MGSLKDLSRHPLAQFTADLEVLQIADEGALGSSYVSISRRRLTIQIPASTDLAGDGIVLDRITEDQIVLRRDPMATTHLNVRREKPSVLCASSVVRRHSAITALDGRFFRISRLHVTTNTITADLRASRSVIKRRLRRSSARQPQLPIPEPVAPVSEDEVVVALRTINNYLDQNKGAHLLQSEQPHWYIEVNKVLG